MSITLPHSNSFRPATYRLVAKILAPLLDSGLVSCTEYDQIVAALKKLVRAKDDEQPQMKLITAQEAAEILGISFSQFRTLESEGAFPFKRKHVGNKTVRYRNIDILRYAASDDPLK